MLHLIRYLFAFFVDPEFLNLWIATSVNLETCCQFPERPREILGTVAYDSSMCDLSITEKTASTSQHQLQ
jgi:hypothetical protein